MGKLETSAVMPVRTQTDAGCTEQVKARAGDKGRFIGLNVQLFERLLIRSRIRFVIPGFFGGHDAVPLDTYALGS